MQHLVRVTGTTHRSSLTNNRPKHSKYFTVNVVTDDVDVFADTKKYLIENGYMSQYDIVKILKVTEIEQ